MSTLRLWWLLRRRRQVDTSDPARLTGVLAVIAFAVTTAMALVVGGGFLAFWRRADAGTSVGDYDGGSYVFLAGFAVLLLLVPLTTLGAAAARLAVARRDARLAALRLAGGTTAQVSALTVLDATLQSVLGGLLGIAGYVALLPVVAHLNFQGRTFDIAELWVGVPVLLGAFAGVVVVALVSALSSLGRVTITPLGVATRVTPPALRAVRVLSVVVAFVALLAANALSGQAGMLVVVLLMAVIAAGMATLNIVGPFILGIVGRIAAGTSRNVATLLAGRRIADDPRTAWRSVGGVALATFIAGITAVAGLVSPDSLDEGQRIFATDLSTGGLLALAIAGVLAAVSTGVLQAGRVIDQRQEYRSLVLAGTDRRTLDRARLRETLIPLVAGMSTSTGFMLLFSVPIIGAGAFAQPMVLLRFLIGVLGAGALVLLGAAASGLIARRMVAVPA
ncbi:hypothetical protein [Propionicicella superfundia]|uniref:hypothetical protein n=1 Tax=Propionicicella superfundia TaxID=348582 RepID=UPI0004081B66|nr:hypothetical protein [Propionicicella superfundia]